MTFDESKETPCACEPPMIVTDHAITVILDGKPNVVASSHPNFFLLLEAIKEKNWEVVAELAHIETAVKTYIHGEGIVVRDGSVFYYDIETGHEEECHGFVVDKILQFMSEGLDPKPLINFLGKVMQNGSFRVIRDLYTFLSNRNMPLDPDGDFYGYKAVRNDWMDKHTGTISNQIGEEIEFPRRKVDDNPQHDCSYGLHVGSIQYVKHFASSYGMEGGDRIIIVKVNPADVVAVPEYDTTKLRCCRYVVVSEYTGLLPDTTWEQGQRVRPDYIGEDDDWYEEDWSEDDDWEEI